MSVVSSRPTHAVSARQPLLLLVGAASLLAIAYVHYYLYFEGGYRGIAPESFAGLTISRAFAVNAVAGFVIAWALVVSLRYPELAVPAALIGAGYAAATLAAFVLSRTVGLLGFEDGQTSPEAVIAMTAEVVALCSLGSWLARRLRQARQLAAAEERSSRVGRAPTRVRPRRSRSARRLHR